jgi:hypothetical protein
LKLRLEVAPVTSGRGGHHHGGTSPTSDHETCELPVVVVADSRHVVIEHARPATTVERRAPVRSFQMD